MTTSHAPGDRVRIQHDPTRDRHGRNSAPAVRAAFHGQIGRVVERSIDGMFRVVVGELGAANRGAWFAYDELVDPEAPMPAAQPPALPSPQDALASLAAVVAEAQALRAACEAVTGTVGLPAGELAARVLAGVQRAGDARARLHEGDPSAVDYVNSRARSCHEQGTNT